VAALAASVMILYLLPLRPKHFHLGLAFYPLSQLFYWVFVSRFLILTFIGIRPVQQPYMEVGQVRRVVYFLYYPLHSYLERGWDVLIGYLQFRTTSRTGLDIREINYDGSLEWGERK